MPYKKVSAIKHATKDILLNFEQGGGSAYLGIYASSLFENVSVKVTSPGTVHLSEVCSLSPTDVYESSVELDGIALYSCIVTVHDNTGKLLIAYQPKEPCIEKLPSPAPEAKPPKEIKSCEELYLVGQHLEQYRHATYKAEDYYKEGLLRDPSRTVD
ncbi:MAG: hypothetical protein WBI82_09425 [Sphaerochaeta sp.]